jgi:hypothetical protein
VQLSELDDTDARFEVGDDGGGPVGRNGRAAKSHAGGAGSSLAGKHTFADHLAFKFSEHARPWIASRARGAKSDAVPVVATIRKLHKTIRIGRSTRGRYVRAFCEPAAVKGVSGVHFT